MTRISNKTTFLFLLAIFYPCLSLIASGQYKYLGVKDDLSSSRVFKSLKDKDGFMWFATRETNKLATYTNISPGTYTFKVKGLYGENSQEIEERSLMITGDPPFWYTLWAWLIYLVTAFLIIAFLYIYQRNRVEKKQSQEKIRFFVNTAQDMRIPVTLIKAQLSDLEKDQSLSDKSRMLLDLSIKNTERLYNLASQILDFQHIDTKPSKLTLSPHNLKEYITEKISSFESLTSTATVNLPNHEPEVDEDGNDYQTEEPPNRKPKLLLVEDNTELKKYISSTLSEKYKIFFASNGKRGLVRMRQILPDIVLADIMMPVMKGDEMCRKIKNNFETSHIPVVLLTGLNEKKRIIEGLETGADDYITKPLDITLLQAKLENILKNRRILKERFLSEEMDTTKLDYQNEMDREFIRKTIHLLEEHIQNTDLTIPFVCRELGISRSVFYQKLKVLTDHSPLELIRIIRMKKALSLLKEGRYNVNEVAYLMGFPNVKYFSTVFKKHYGKTPSSILEEGK